MVTPDEIVIREYREGDEDQINLLHNKEYGTSRSAEEWQWEFKNGPYGESILAVAEHKGEIIGTQALLPVILSYTEAQILSAKSEETLLNTKFRGQGVFQRLYDRCFELAAKRGIALIWGFTNAEKPFRKCGFNIAGRVNHFFLILDPAQTFRINRGRIPAQVRSRLPYQVGQTLLLRVFTLIGFLWYRMRNRKISPNPRFEVVPVSQADEKFDLFWEAFRREGSFYTIARTSNYLNWRIFSNPHMNYELLTVSANDRVQGYIVLGKSERDNVGYISDFCVLNRHFEEVAGLLVSHAIEYFRSQRAAYVDVWRVGSGQESKKYSSQLRKSGFVPFPMGSCVVMKALAEEGDFPTNPSCLDQWFITHLFSEGVA